MRLSKSWVKQVQLAAPHFRSRFGKPQFIYGSALLLDRPLDHLDGNEKLGNIVKGWFLSDDVTRVRHARTRPRTHRFAHLRAVAHRAHAERRSRHGGSARARDAREQIGVGVVEPRQYLLLEHVGRVLEQLREQREGLVVGGTVVACHWRVAVNSRRRGGRGTVEELQQLGRRTRLRQAWLLW